MMDDEMKKLSMASGSLLERQSMLAWVFEVLPVGLGIVDPHGTLLFANHKMQRYLPINVIPSSDAERHWRWRGRHPDGKAVERTDFPMARALRGESVVPGLDMLYTSDDGEEVWTRVSSVPLRDNDGSVTGAFCVVADIDALKRATDAQAESEDRLRNAMAAGRLGSWEWNVQTGEVVWDEPCRKMFGIPDHLPMTYNLFFQHIHAGDREAVHAAVRQALLDKRALDIELRVLLPDGNVRWIQARGKARYDGRGNPVHMLGVAQDMTERQMMEGALREKEHRLEQALDIAKLATYTWDLASGTLQWDARLKSMFGLPADATVNFDTWAQAVHPEDRQQVLAAVERALDPCSDGIFEAEYRAIGIVDGVERWVLARGTVSFSEGRPARYVGIAADTTERKQTEHRLERFTQELERQVAERTESMVASEARLRALTIELTRAEQRERTRLAGELHDHLQQVLVLGKLQLSGGKQRIADPAALEMMRKVDELLTEALGYTRTLVADLSPPALRDHGLPAALLWLSDYMKKYDLQVDVTIAEAQAVALPAEQSALLYQCVRELLTNVVKHGRTCAAAVRLSVDDRVRIQVHDEGIGFDVSAAQEPTPSAFGLFSIQERMKALGGSFHVESSLGRGTTVTLLLPAGPEATQSTLT